MTCTYDAAHHVTQRTDALGQQTRYTYDIYGRLTETQHWAWVIDPVTHIRQLQEQILQRVDYYCDTNPLDAGFTSQNAWGRLAAVTFNMGMSY